MNRTTQLASALLALGDVPYEHAKRMAAEQLISLYQWDHNVVRKSEGGSEHFSNYRPMLIAAHRSKTRLDVREIAKNKRVKTKHELHLERMRQK